MNNHKKILEIDRLCIDYEPITPQKLIDWLQKIDPNTWSNVSVHAYTDVNDNTWIALNGARDETEYERKLRLQELNHQQQSDYHAFLKLKNFYENTPEGQTIAQTHSKTTP